MPQKRNPVSLEHARSLLSSCIGLTNAALSMLHNTPYGDIVDTEDDMQPYLWKALRVLGQVYRLVARVLDTLEVNKELLLQRCRDSFCTATELADTLVREHHLTFRDAHAITSIVVRRAEASGLRPAEVKAPLLQAAALEVLQRELAIQDEAIRKALDSEHFVRIRTMPGGTNPDELRASLQNRERQLGNEVLWHEREAGAIAQALADLDHKLALVANRTYRITG
jgi:argininosuccinate lyase